MMVVFFFIPRSLLFPSDASRGIWLSSKFDSDSDGFEVQECCGPISHVAHCSTNSASSYSILMLLGIVMSPCDLKSVD